MEFEAASSDIPKKIKQAAYLVYLSLLIGFLKAILYETMTSQKMLTDPKTLTIVILTLLLIGFLGFMIGQGKNWARITLLVFFILGMIGYPFIVIGEFQISWIIGIVSIAQMLIQVYVLIILFSGESKEWFKAQKVKTTPI